MKSRDMHHSFWICLILSMFLVVSETKKDKVKTKCPVSDLHVSCSSSNSIHFKWKLGTIWSGPCRNQTFKIKYFPSGTERFKYSKVDILKKEVLINELDRDINYKFKFVHYLEFTNQIDQVKNGYKEAEGTPHGVEGVINLKVSNIESTSVKVHWEIAEQERDCISSYMLRWCWHSHSGDKCKSRSVATSEPLVLDQLTPCTQYSLSVSTVDIDLTPSTKTVNTAFSTTSKDEGTVKDLSLHEVTPTSLSIVWLGQSCSPFHVSIISLRKGHPPKSYVTNDTAFTFVSLQPCSLYHISVSVSNQEADKGSTSQLQAYTSIISNATVYNLGAYYVTDHGFNIAWMSSFPSWMICATGYQVQVSSMDQTIQTRQTSTPYIAVRDLEACTSYEITVTVVFSHSTLSQQSVSISARTHAPDKIMNQNVKNILVTQQTSSSLDVTWEQPSHGAECLQGYDVFLYDEGYNVVYSQSQVPVNNTDYTFVNLKPCKLYYVYITPHFGFHFEANQTHFRRQEFKKTCTYTSENVTVMNLTMETRWNTIQLWWSPPTGYEVCTRQYEVQVCSKVGCEEHVLLDTNSYILNNQPACTVYTAQVRAGHSYERASVTGITRGPDPVFSNKLKIVNETSNSIKFSWTIPEDFENCEGKFSLVLQDDYGFVIEEKKMDHLTNEYTVQSLKPCHSYHVKLSLIDSEERIIINYVSQNGITKASGDQEVEGVKMSPFATGITLEWSMNPGFTACLAAYQISLKKRDGLLLSHNTTEPKFTWTGDPCILDEALVQMVSIHGQAGKPVITKLKNQLEDLSKLSVSLSKEGVQATNVKLLATGFVCVTDYTVSWYRVNNRSTSDFVANYTSATNRSVTLRQLQPCSTYSVKITVRNGITVIGTLSSAVSTDYAEPVMIASLEPIAHGFNVSWQPAYPDTIYCLSHVVVLVKNRNFYYEDKIFNASYKVIRNLIPCQDYSIILETATLKEKHKRTFYSKWERVAAEVLPVPGSVTLVSVTRESVTLEWDVGVSDYNMCHPRDLEVQCRPSRDLNTHSAGWSPITLRLSRLTPYTHYHCELRVINEAGPSNTTRVSFLTSQGAPSQPRNVTVIAKSSIDVLVTWTPPDYVPGVLANYTVVVFNQTLTYPLPPGCPRPSLVPHHVVVGADITQAVVRGLSPATSLWVSVTAATFGGYGPSSQPVASVTLDQFSDPVMDLNATVTFSKILLSWRRPCLTNGPLDFFLIQLNGTRPNHTTSSFHWNITAQTVSENYSTSLNVSLLTAESIYTATVIPVGVSASRGLPASQNFIVPSRIPTRPSDAVFAELPPVQTTRSTAIVSIRSDLFPDTEGTIRFYAIIVAGNFTYGPRADYIRNETWPKSKTWAAAAQTYPVSAYQATPSWWNPFKGLDTTPFAIRQYTLGEEECSKSELTTFCNGPLLPGTSYLVRVRAFTSSGFRDSPSISFQTVDLITEAYLIILALLILALATIIAFTYLVVKGHIEWNQEKKKGLTNSNLKTQNMKISLKCEQLPLVKFINHVENIVTSESLLDEEYKVVSELTKEINESSTIARLPHNIMKNRYKKDIIPYDSALVKLEGDEASSYINASHIKLDDKKSRCYIACQGPMEGTCETFWNMVLQYKVEHIVMLCRFCEDGRMKCFPYFPTASGEVSTFGKIKVYCTKEDTFSSYISRNLTIDKEGTNFRVKHFQFTEWIDKGTPNNPELLVKFIEDIRKMKKQKSITVVHCSAGVGRTGTFIAVDELLRRICDTWSCTLSIPPIVLQLRELRHNKMVQTQDQYRYIYKCLKYALDHPSSLSKKVRNAVMSRSKFELGTTEMVTMSSSSIGSKPPVTAPEPR